MRGAVGVRVDPAQHLVVTDVQGVVEALADNVEILVAAEALQVNRAAVEQDTVALHLDGAHAEALRIFVQHGP